MKLTATELQRLNDLTADDAVFGLDASETAELEQLKARSDRETLRSVSRFNVVVAQVIQAGTPLNAPPDAFVEELQKATEAYFEASQAEPRQRPLEASTNVTTAQTLTTRTPIRGREVLAWTIASTLAIVLIVKSLQSLTTVTPEIGPQKDQRDIANAPTEGVPVADDSPRRDPDQQAVAGNSEQKETGEIPIPELSLSQQREQLLAQDDVLDLKWLPSKDPTALVASGGVVWSNKRQEGFLTFIRLAVNDPTVEQYQLWIIDGQRDLAQPVDGGVFDIQQNDQEVIVRINAKLKVFDPQAFAITIERPGGVVVSDRSRLPLLASRDAI